MGYPLFLSIVRRIAEEAGKEEGEFTTEEEARGRKRRI
jgi:hypothetical protein